MYKMLIFFATFSRNVGMHAHMYNGGTQMFPTITESTTPNNPHQAKGSEFCTIILTSIYNVLICKAQPKNTVNYDYTL